MGKILRAIPRFVSWEQGVEFWSTHDLTDLDLQESLTPLVTENRALGRVKKIEVVDPNIDTPMDRKTA